MGVGLDFSPVVWHKLPPDDEPPQVIGDRILLAHRVVSLRKIILSRRALEHFGAQMDRTEAFLSSRSLGQ